MSLREFIHLVWWVPLLGCYILCRWEQIQRNERIDKYLKDQEALVSKGESRD